MVGGSWPQGPNTNPQISSQGRGSLKMGVFAFRRKKQDSPFQPKAEIPFPVVAREVEYITIEAKHRGRGRCFHRAMNFLDCLGKRIFYGGHS